MLCWAVGCLVIAWSLAGPVSASAQVQASPLTVRYYSDTVLARSDVYPTGYVPGETYTITAIPPAGSVFLRWFGPVSSTDSSISFVMSEGLVLQARCVKERFLPVAGTYQGLFYGTNQVHRLRCGSFRLVVSSAGAYSGALTFPFTNYAFAGILSINARGSFVVAPPDRSAFTVRFQLDLTNGTDRVTGSLSTANWAAQLLGDRRVFHGVTNRAPLAGAYTLVIPGDPTDATVPGGDSYAVLTIRPNGRVDMTGALASGPAFSLSTAVSKEGDIPFFVPAYAGKGCAIAWLKVTGGATAGINGLLTWIKPGGQPSVFYPVGFTNQVEVLGSPYVAPTGAPARILQFTNGLTTFCGGNLASCFTNEVALDAPDLLTNLSTNPLTVTFTRTNGLTSGWVTDPDSGRSIPFTGVVLQNQNRARGFFKGSNQCGRFELRTTYRLPGLNVGPYIDGQDPAQGSIVTIEQLRSRLGMVASDTEWVRSFSCTHGLENFGQVAHEFGLKAAMSAWISSDLAANEIELTNLVVAGQSGQADLLIVGSEVLLRGDVSEELLLGYIDRVKQAVPGVPLTTADTHSIWLAHSNLIAAVDVLMVNYYPFWEGIKLNNAMATLHTWHSSVTQVAGGKPVWVSETGWPSNGDPLGLAVPSAENAAAYFLNFVSWARANGVFYFYFVAFDEAWKTREGSTGPHWGIRDKTGILKPGMDRVFADETMPDNWSGLDIPGGPGTPSIAFTHVPAWASSEPLEGQVLHVRPADYRVVVYVKVDNSWWVKPTFASPQTMIGSDGAFTCAVVTGGNDHLATDYVAYVLPSDYSPPLAAGLANLPSELETNAVAKATHTRSP